MRRELFTNPYLLFERIGQYATSKLRSRKIKKYGLAHLNTAHYDHFELLELLIGKVDVIYDIGANKGFWSEMASKILNPSTVYCFEPFLEFYNLLESKVIHYPNWILFPYALGVSDSEQRFFLAGDSSSILPLTNLQTEHFGVSSVGETIIKTKVLNDFMKSNQLKHPDLIKIDVQGYEMEVLKGADKVITEARYLLIELSFKEFYHQQPAAEEVIAFLFQKGFRIKAFSESTALGQEIFQTDILFENSILRE